MFTSWGDLYPQGKFFCNSCLKKMEKEEYNKKMAKFREIAEFAKQITRPKPNLKQAIISVIKNVCTEPDWYQLKNLTEKTNLECDVRQVSHILNELGFTQRKRKKHGSYTHVFIDRKILEGAQGVAESNQP